MISKEKSSRSTTPKRERNAEDSDSIQGKKDKKDKGKDDKKERKKEDKGKSKSTSNTESSMVSDDKEKKEEEGGSFISNPEFLPGRKRCLLCSKEIDPDDANASLWDDMSLVHSPCLYLYNVRCHFCHSHHNRKK
jgi:hypothetical protein